MALKQTKVDDVAALVRHLLETHTGGVRWFRGQGCHHRPLKSSLARRLSPYSPNELLRKEQRLITRFRQRSLPLWPEGYPQVDWEHLFAMQHFGVPTRLLDWSENALVGVYFAADHDPRRCECETGECLPTLWVLDPIALNRKNSRLDGYGESLSVMATSDDALDPWSPGTEETRFAPWPVAIYGTHNSPRIVAQQGTFTVSGKKDAPLEAAPAVVDNEGVLEQITIAVDRLSIMRQLKILGVSRATVFPDLTGLAHDITSGELSYE